MTPIYNISEYKLTFFLLQMKTWSSIGLIVGSIMCIFGIGMLVNADYGLPPIPFGYVLALVFFTLGGAFLLSSVTLCIHKDVPNASKYLIVGMIGITLLILGLRTYILHPYETPECLCEAGYYSEDCLPCKCVNGECNDGNKGNGVCLCEMGWDGEFCDKCARTFEGENCDTCKRGWDGYECDRCYPGYTGSNCDRCEPNWIPEIDSLGTLCRYCKPGFWGGFCKACPQCDTHDSLAFCRDNEWWKENKYNSQVCNFTPQICEDDYDCSSFNCKGLCVIGDDFTGQYCQNDRECNQGTCQFKSCCVESKHGDGECECNRDGYWGPLCEPCPGFDGIYSASICTGHGTCAAAYVGDDVFSHLTCECAPDSTTPFPTWSGAQCGCLIEEEGGDCTECADGFFGTECSTCPGGGGISQCSLHGKCNDGIEGDGTCLCDLDIKTNGLGGWKTGDSGTCDTCFSNDFYSDSCKVCKSTKEVGFETRASDGKPNTPLPNGNWLLTCPRENEVCSPIGGCM